MLFIIFLDNMTDHFVDMHFFCLFSLMTLKIRITYALHLVKTHVFLNIGAQMLCPWVGTGNGQRKV